MAKVVGKEDYDLKKAWDEACDAFAKTASEDLKTKTKYTPDQVLEQIRAKQDKDEEKNAKYRVAKDVLSKTLDCIDNLGNIAAQGASMVFGPAGFAGNALSYLIATGAKYKYIFNSLAELFSKISDFLARFKIYFRMPEVDISLRIIINELLICFVSICGLSIKILKGNKALLYLKVFAFSDDAGVNAKLGELAALVEKEREMRGTLGYEVEKNIERSVATGRTENKEGFRALGSTLAELADSDKKREASTMLAKQLEFIEKALDSPSDSYKTIQQDFMDKKVNGTGDWLQQNSDYLEWTVRKPASRSILSLSGGEGYGKSFLMSIVVQDLRKRFPPGAEENASRTSVAYYYFQREAKGSKSAEKNALSLSNALKSLAWQIGKRDAVYRKELHAACDRIEDTEISDLWTKLFTNSYKSDATFYLLLDGVDNMEEKHLNVFSQVLQQALERPKDIKERGPLCLRILISGRNKVVEELTQQVPVSTIDLASNNKDDIDKFVRDGISNIKILGGTSEADQARREEIFTALSKYAKGDFISVDLLLKQIAEKRRTAEMLEVLEKFQGEDRSDTIARSIEGLNKTLGRQDIIDLNELLVWVISSFRGMTLEELDTILLMTNGVDGYSLQPLAESINERYSKIFKIDGVPDSVTKKMPVSSQVLMTSESIEEYFRQSKEEQDNSLAPKSANNGDVNESEVRIVRRFLESVCDPELFNKFQFESFFQNKLTTSTAIIKFENEASHLKILSDCLDVLCSEDEKWDLLLDYVLSYFHIHLSMIDLSLTLPKEKTVIGGKLLRLFTDKKIIAKWWQDTKMTEMRWNWLNSEYFADFVLNWFKDSAVVKGLGEDDKQWAKDLTSNSRPEADLLEHVAKFLADKWLRDSYWGLDALVMFLHGFVSKIEGRLDPSKGTSWKEINSMDEISADDIQLMLKWAKTKLGIDTLDYEELRNLARTYRDCGENKEAIVMFKDAALMKEDNWLCRWGLSIAYGAEKEWALAIETLEDVIQKIRSGESKEDAPGPEIPEMQRELAQYTRNSGNTKKAIEMYESMLTEFPEDYDTAYEYLTYLAESKNFSQLLQFINNMKASKDEKSGLDRWTTFYHQYAEFSVYHETIVNAAYEGGSLEIVKDGYASAVEAAKVKKKAADDATDTEEQRTTMSTTATLIHYFASFQYYTRLSEDSTKVAIMLWEQILGFELNDATRMSYLPWTLNLVRRHLPFAYVRLAKESGYNPETVEECVAKIRALISKPDEDYYYDTVTPKHALARLYTSIGNILETKEVLKSQIKIDLELLSDDDPENDWQGYQGLGASLMFAGEKEHALAAWSLITPFEFDGEHPDEETKAPVSTTLENGTEPEKDETDASTKVEVIDSTEPKSSDISSKEESKSTVAQTEVGTTPTETKDAAQSSGELTQEFKQPFRGPMSLTCDGTCGASYGYTDDFYACLDCTDVLFNEPCLAKLRAGTLGRLVCGKDHEMFHFPKYDAKKMKAIGKGNVEVGGKVVTVKEWLDMVRREWGLEVVTEVHEEKEVKSVVGETVVEVNVEA